MSYPTGDAFLYDLGYDDGYSAVLRGTIDEDAPHWSAEPALKRGYRHGIKAARKAIEEGTESSPVVAEIKV